MRIISGLNMPAIVLGRSPEEEALAAAFSLFLRMTATAVPRGGYAVVRGLTPPLLSRSLTTRAACGWTRRLRATRGAALRPRPAGLGRVEAKGDIDPVQRRKQRRQAQEVRVRHTPPLLSLESTGGGSLEPAVPVRWLMDGERRGMFAFAAAS